MRLPLAAVLSVTVSAVLLSAGPAFGAGNITTVAGPGDISTPGDGGPATQAYVGSPVGVTAMSDGGYLIAHQSNPAVRRVFPDGTITTIAGNGVAGYSGDGGPATAASLNGVSSATPTPDGGYLLSDINNNVIRRVAPDGTISTVAGTGGASFGGDGGPATSAQLSFPYDTTFMPDGSYLIADENNSRIRRVDTAGNITTVAGGGGVVTDGVPATMAQLIQPDGVTATPDGGYLITEYGGNRIRKVGADGTINTVAGTGTAGDTGDGGAATAAQLNHPTRTALEPDGGFLISEDTGSRVRRVAPDGTITTIAGDGTTGFSGDGGPATVAQLNRAFGVAVLANGDIVIADAANNRIRLVDEVPPAPTLLSTSPASPNASTTPLVVGAAPAGTTVDLFTTADCSGTAVANGTAAQLAAPGIAVTVPAGTTSTFHAVATDASANRSPCSTSSVSYTASALPAPVIGRKVNAVPEKGQVLVKVPGGKFVKLQDLGRQIPVGATIDTRKGTVRLTTATLRKKGKPGTQVGRFSKGLFKLDQKRKNPLTTLSMVGGGLNACSRLPSGGAAKTVAGAKRKRQRRLFSNVKGRFRTRGRNSSATVRGTQWTMTDTCKGTRTSVSRGSVTVQDFNLRKKKVVKAGHFYFARAPKLLQRRGNR